MKIFLGLARLIDVLNRKLGESVSWLTLVLVIVICIDVIMRYLFSSTKTWVLELEWHLFSIIFLIGAAYTLLSDKHVRVDLFYEQFKPSRKRLVDTIGVLIFLIPWSCVIIYYGFEYALNSFSFKEGSPQPNGLPARYLIKSFISIGFFLLLLQGISIVIHSLFDSEE